MSATRAIDRFGVVGFNHRQIPARLRGALAFDEAWCVRLAAELTQSKLADGVAFVSTCNRQEIVLSAEHPAFALELVRAQLHSLLLERAFGPLPEPYRHVGEEAVRHVLRVSASLDSLVVGERQITGQLRRSFEQARHHGWMDKPLNGLARIAVENAKEIHQRTSLSAESVGVFSLARDLVLQQMQELGKTTFRVAVVGLGEIGLKTARALVADKRLQLTLSSRRPRTAPELGVSLAAQPFRSLDDLPGILRDSDAVILATGAREPVVDETILQAARAGVERPLVLVDIGIPPQAAGECDGVAHTRLFNMDWFTSSGFGQRPQAKEALRKAQDIVEEGVRRVAEWTSVRRYSGLFDSCVLLTEQFKAQVIPEVLKTELGTLTPEQQRQVFASMHKLLTSYSEGLFQTLSRALNDHALDAVEPARGTTDDVHDPAADHR